MTIEPLVTSMSPQWISFQLSKRIFATISTKWANVRWTMLWNSPFVEHKSSGNIRIAIPRTVANLLYRIIALVFVIVVSNAKIKTQMNKNKKQKIQFAKEHIDYTVYTLKAQCIGPHSIFGRLDWIVQTLRCWCF